jgi:hypothetical protein
MSPACRSGRRNKFSSFGAGPLFGLQSCQGVTAAVGSGPDVFADALVLGGPDWFPAFPPTTIPLTTIPPTSLFAFDLAAQLTGLFVLTVIVGMFGRDGYRRANA